MNHVYQYNKNEYEFNGLYYINMTSGKYENRFYLLRLDGTTVPAVSFYQDECPGSNWWWEPFEYIDRKSNTRYVFSSEQCMMGEKALLFNNHEMVDKIFSLEHPKNQKESHALNGLVKRMGRSVKNFEKDVWNSKTVEIMSNILVQKFKKCERAQEWLYSTNDMYLIEGATYDKIWGVGIHFKNTDIQNEANWLGQSIMIAREMLNNSSEKMIK